ncbi:MAG TPA: hypothetical protein VFG10_03935 [Saprospiraceae bacterium]|nr:hypothetical protein [Saprospiraceae bacterium]
MSNFLNINLDKKITGKFLIKHIIFSAFWIAGILIFIFRIDAVIMGTYGENLKWLIVSIPTFYLLLLLLYFVFLKWYYIVAFFIYPLLMIFWFIPKTVLSIGKVYLFGSYLSSIFIRLKNYKLFLFNLFLYIFSTIFLLTLHSDWSKWLAIGVASYFYLIYILRFLRKAFKLPSLFGENIEKYVRQFVDTNSPKNSLIISSYVVQKEDEKLEIEVRREKQIRRSVLAKYALELLSKRLNGYRGRQAYIVSWIFGSLVFLFFSIIFFWFLNFQLYRIDITNFEYIGHYPSFDFLYYTLKTITFSDIDLVKPKSVLARISETSSFFTIGIFALVIVVSILLSLKQDKMIENVRLTTEMFEHENLNLSKYMQDEFGMEITSAMKEVKNIDESFKNLKAFVDKIF